MTDEDKTLMPAELSDAKTPDDQPVDAQTIKAAADALEDKRVKLTEQLTKLTVERWNFQAEYVADLPWYPWTRPTPAIHLTIPTDGGELHCTLRMMYGQDENGLPVLYPLIEILFAAPGIMADVDDRVNQLVQQFTSMCLSRAVTFRTPSEGLCMAAALTWPETQLDVIVGDIPRYARIVMCEFAILLRAIDQLVDQPNDMKADDHVSN